MPRPLSVTFLALAVLCLAVFNLFGAVSGVQRYAFLRTLPLAVSPAYLIASRAAWGIVFSVVALGLWRLKQWGRLGALAAFSLYAAQAWFDRLVLSRSDFARTTAPYALGVSLVGLALVWGILFRRKVKQCFSA
ncbi:MAG TPA: hypothetical protein VI793_15325 [Anaerolineales bacterium]|nr:hypothetical protein [Anaerolineales bacterium]